MPEDKIQTAETILAPPVLSSATAASAVTVEPPDDDDSRIRRILNKVSWRLIPFMLLLYVIAYLDRINVSFAGLQMNKDLGFSAETFGFGAGIFFVGYFLFGVPANLVLEKVGACRWIALIMIVWGFITASFTVVRDEFAFYALRFLLGIAEAGFFPGMIFYLTFWFPKKMHGTAVARFMIAIPVAGVAGGLIASQILAMHGIGGLPGWKWLFLVTGLLPVVLGAIAYFYLTDSPRQARWLQDEERELLIASILSERTEERREKQGPGVVLMSSQVWFFALIYFCLTLGMYGFQLWLPQIIKSFGAMDDSTSALLTAIPAVFQAFGMIVVARVSDRKSERTWCVAASAWLAAVGLFGAAMAPHPIAAFCSLCVSAFGLWGVVGPFWAIPTSTLSRATAASGIALINSVGNLGGFAGPYLVGLVKQTTGSFFLSLAVLGISLVIAGLLVLRRRQVIA